MYILIWYSKKLARRYVRSDVVPMVSAGWSSYQSRGPGELIVVARAIILLRVLLEICHGEADGESVFQSNNSEEPLLANTETSIRDRGISTLALFRQDVIPKIRLITDNKVLRYCYSYIRLITVSIVIFYLTELALPVRRLRRQVDR